MSRLETCNINVITRAQEKLHQTSPFQNITNNNQTVPNSKPTLDIVTHQDSNKIISITEPEDIKKILYEYHDAPAGGHQGISRTFKKIKTKFTWKNMFKDIFTHVKSCQTCQKNKTYHKSIAPMIITSTSKTPFERISLDLVGPLPISEHNNKYILTFQDDLTKFIQAIPIPIQEASTVSEVYVRKIICVFGNPKTLLTDQGTNFLSELFKNVCKLFKIKKIQTSSYHPQTNGGLERSHRSLGDYIRNYASQNPDTWDEWIDFAVFCYNTTPHTATKHTPFELLFGFKPIIPSALTKTVDIVYNYDDYLIELKNKLQKSYEIARNNIYKAKEVSKNYYDKNTKIINFKIGDKVLLAIKNRTNKKLTPAFNGPYEIIEIKGPVNYILKIGNKHKLVHINMLKPFIEKQVLQQSQP